MKPPKKRTSALTSALALAMKPKPGPGNEEEYEYRVGTNLHDSSPKVQEIENHRIILKIFN